MSSLRKQLSIVTLGMVLTAPAHSAIIDAASDGNALTLGIFILGAPLLSLDLLAEANGSTPGTYSEHNDLPLDVNAGSPLVATADVGADLIYGDASYDGTTVQGDGGVENLVLAVDGLLGLQYIALTADTLYSDSSITGDYDNWTPSGSSVITNLQLGLLGSALDLSAYAGAAPNTVVDILGLLGIAGVHLVLNEQSESCDAASCAISTNALHLWADPVNLELADTDIMIGRSHAEVSGVYTPTPIPGTIALLLGGFGVLGSLGGRRNQV